MKNIVGGQFQRARLGVALGVVASLILGGIFISSALAAHTAGVTAEPTIVAGGATNTYSFTITNDSGSANFIYLINITAPTGFTITSNPVCPTGWGTDHTNTIASCIGDSDPSANLNLQPGATATVSFSAISSTPSGDTLTSWTVTTKDNAFTTVTNSEPFSIDVTPPTTTDNATGGWLNTSPASIILSPSDVTAGVAATYYTLDGQNPTTSSTLYEGPISIASQGTTTLKYFSVDNVGNAEGTKTNTVSIDTAAPSISSVNLTLPGGQTAVKEGDTITISADITDGISGVANVTVDLSPLGGVSDYPLNLSIGNTYTNDFVVPVAGTADGAKTIVITAIDNASNSAGNSSSSVVFDNTAPVVANLQISPVEAVTAVRNDTNISLSGTVDSGVANQTGTVLVGATLRQYDEFEDEILDTEMDVTSSVTLTNGVLSAPSINVGTLDETAVAIAIEIIVTDESLNQTTAFSSILEVDNSAPILAFTILVPPQMPYAQINVKDTDEVQVLVETDSNTANTVTIDASAFGASNSIALSPVDGSGTQFAGGFIVNSNGDNTNATISVSVRRINNGAITNEPSDPLTIDNTLPTFSSIIADPDPTKDGTVTITFTASETLLANPTVMINGALATFSEGSIAPDYTYTYEVADNNEVLPATITITGIDEAANEGTDNSASFTIDTLEPTVTTVDSDGARFNAGVKTITVIFSESLSVTPKITVDYPGQGGFCTNVATTDMTGGGNEYAYDVTIEESCDAATAIVTISTGADPAGNVMVTDGNHTFTVDTVAPAITSAITADSNGNGQIDTIVVSFDEDLDGESVTAGDFTVTDYAVTNTVESATGTVTLTVTESVTPDTGTTPLVEIAVDGSIADIAGNINTSDSVTSTDGAAPIAVSAETINVNTIEVTFSEDINGASVSAADFAITDHTISDTSELSGIVTLTLSSALGTGETPTVSVAGNGSSSGVQDLASNWTSTHNVATTDGIAPVVMSVTLVPTSPVKAEEITFTIIFSEPMDETVAPTVTYDPQGTSVGADPQTITQTSFTGTTWVGIAIIPSGDALNYDGTAVISISGATDASSNVMSEDTSAEFDIDTVAPDAPSVDAIDSPQNIDSIQVTGTAEANSLITITGGNSEATGYADSSGNFGISVNLTQDETNNLSITATDAAGNVSNATTAEIVEDSTPPVAPNITTESQIVNTNTITIAGAAEADSTITITGGTVEETDTATNGNFSIEITLNQNILNTLSVTATDAAGNTSPFSTLDITHDNIPPVATFDTGLPVSPTNQTEATIAVSNGDVVAYQYDLDGGGYSAEIEVTTPISLINITEGDHTLSVIGRDEAGNWQETPTTYTWTVDTTAPTLTNLSIVSNNNFDTTLAKVNDTITLSFIADDNITTPTVFIAGNEAVVSGDLTSWTATYTLTGSEVEGVIAFTIDFTDIAGNNGTEVIATTDGSSVIFDQTAPVINIVSPLAGASVNGNATISFDDNELTDPECSIDNETWEVCESGVTSLYQIPGFDALPEGAFALYIQDTDNAGNTGNDNESGIIKDTIAPSILSHIPGTNAVNIEPAGNITITFSEAVNVGTESITFSPWVSFTVDGSGTNTITLIPDPALDDNTVYTITISTNVSDAAGNQLQDYYSWQFTTATQYDIPLYIAGGGWNLISLPIIPNDKSISAVLGNAEGSVQAVWTYDPSHPNAVDGWLVYVPGDPEGTNNLDTMTTGYGYWISINEDTNISGVGNLLTAGPNLPPSRDLGAGWNLIGYYQIPGESSSNPASAFSSLGGTYTGLWGFDNTAGSFKSTIYDILPGDAFWISLPSAKTYTPSNVNNET